MNPEATPAPSGEATVVLEIGGDRGALVLHTEAALLGAEIELQGESPTSSRVHSAVRERRLEVGTAFAAIYPTLVAGRYHVVGSDLRVDVAGGRVTEVSYPRREPPEEGCCNPSSSWSTVH